MNINGGDAQYIIIILTLTEGKRTYAAPRSIVDHNTPSDKIIIKNKRTYNIIINRGI